ncbi:hypothetical protein [Shewanella sp. 10N.286.48.B5]|uniref:hypothetical protein n=1 Tax=Shewanella sp. 10N.286.48.B5 TaxID=1880834 RepID=UPI0010555941|nr:hypothetical protein [Shewanella sp. 10N.286.48.B5]
MRILIVFLLISLSNVASATAFTLGTGGYWKKICSGMHDEFDSKSAIASCTMLLLGYQVGAFEQAKLLSKPATLCRSFNPNTLPQEFVDFVNSNSSFEEMDVLDVLLQFAKGGRCGV